ncbi:hypothetical protein [Moheibacter sediminis]|uniref:dTDP-4-amino-4,6-dideoxygalactose transaminase n=1 Tax=Moheibacter sediminis TaxID=1434700 RepID=A0A1W1YXB0_9FLAO|nr:hypothetical protein [Moheibacter sediminis]SMC40732.1 hypothetical protein SAMN06296427_1026 [Moheibacter sediminis]
METKAIGGYFELEIPFGKPLHGGGNCIELNSGRNCLEYILRVKKYTKIYIPFYTCDAVLEPINKLDISFEFYDIDNNLEPIFNYNLIKDSEVFLYTNYFGIKDDFIKNKIQTISGNLVIDNAQAFFSKPIENVDTFYSPRKFVGVSDGGILYSNKRLQGNFKKDESHSRMSHLLKRIDLSAENGYSDFGENEASLEHQPIKQMSNLTKRILSGIDYEKIKEQRRSNFELLHQHLKTENLLKLELDMDSVPLVYPFRTKNADIKNKLHSDKIYCATYWPNVAEWCNEDTNSYSLAREIVALPIDQRYCKEEMNKILYKINN